MSWLNATVPVGWLVLAVFWAAALSLLVGLAVYFAWLSKITRRGDFWFGPRRFTVFHSETIGDDAESYAAVDYRRRTVVDYEFVDGGRGW